MLRTTSSEITTTATVTAIPATTRRTSARVAAAACSAAEVCSSSASSFSTSFSASIRSVASANQVAASISKPPVAASSMAFCSLAATAAKAGASLSSR